MKKITEQKIGNKSIYTVEEIFADKVVDKYDISVQTVVVDYKNIRYLVVYNSEYEVITDAYRFLNHNKKQLAKNTVIKNMYALKYLYAFSKIIDKDIPDFNYNDFIKLNYFLKGISAQGIDLEFNLLTKRGNQSVLGFFTVYREFYKFIGLNKSPLFEENSFAKYIPTSTNKTYTSYKKAQEVPKFISVEEFKKLVRYIRENIKDKETRLRDECIIRIMFEGGLRLGEVLGSALEDYVVKDVGEGNEAREICYVYIRNRLTDKKFQNAKTCMNVHSRSNYMKNEYTVKNVGYQLSFLSVDTYDLIGEYIDIAHEKAFKEKKSYYRQAQADAVDEFKTKRMDNYYLFLNSRGTPLSDVSWNKKLRSLFEEVAIEIDYGVKKDNLSHRFRHGFIMNLIHNIKLPREQVKVRSRHKSYASLDCYYNPTTEQIVSMKTDIEDGILNLDDVE